MKMKILKGIGAILAGIVFIVVTHTLTDLVLEKLGIFPPPAQGFHITWMVVTATIYRSLYTVRGGYITAALAPDPRMRYVIILGVIGLALGTFAAIVTIPMKLGPAWYPIALAVLALPCVWLGGKLRTRS
jgi:cobalamin synthase